MTEQLNQKLEHVSLGLSGKQITQVIKSTSVPMVDENRLTETQCNDSTLKSASTTSKQ